MINEVRNTVMSILNKDNRGYITPFEFNLYAKQAQLDVFEEYIYLYSEAMNKQNLRGHGENYSDVVKNIQESMDKFFVVSNNLTYSSGSFAPPSDYYMINKIFYNEYREVEKVDNTKIIMLNASNLTKPSILYPVYTLSNKIGTSVPQIKVYPSTITSNIKAHYLRYPKEPKWTYVAVGPGDSDPLFNPSASDYQDFEVPLSDFSFLVYKILKYAGVSIREADVVEVARAEEAIETIQKQ